MRDEGMYWMEFPLLFTGKSGQSGTPTLFVDGEITHRKSDVEGEEPIPIQGEKATLYLYLSEKALPYTIERLQPLGFNGDFNNPALSERGAKGFWVECFHDTFDGNTRAKFRLPGGVERVSCNAETIRRLNALWRSQAKTTPKAPAAPASGNETAEAPAGEEAVPVGADGPPKVDENGTPF